MSSSKEEASLSFSNPCSSEADCASNYLIDSSSQFSSNSAPNSFQNDNILFYDNEHPDIGFSRPDFRQSNLLGTVQFYRRHLFLCYKNPPNWPPSIQAAEFDRLPRLLSAALASRKSDMNNETRLTICEGRDGTETSNGDVLIFPDMIRYRRLTHFDVDTFVEEVLIKDGEWLPGNPEKLKGWYIFVCCHGSRDRRCGVCGPPLVARFKEEVNLRGLQGKVSISPCSHVGGHKFAGNVIIFGSRGDRKVTGHWYGYVTPDDVPNLLEQHVLKGEIVEWLWRGQMGLSEEEQQRAQELRLHNKEGNHRLTSMELPEINSPACGSHSGTNGCCQVQAKGNGTYVEKEDDLEILQVEKVVSGKKGKKVVVRNNSSASNGVGKRKVCAMPSWFENWEREDTYAALAVVCAALSVGIAYTCYKQL
ncbi:unnamed protein product [Amaranthus hypochondriacus]